MDDDHPFIEPRPTTLAAPVDLEKDHVLGDAAAPLHLVEYGDYECPDCGRAYPMLKELQQRFGNQLLFVFRHFPLYTIHHHASIAAQAAEAAGAQGQFWKMHDLLYEHQDSLVPLDLEHHAIKLGLDVYAFNAALSTGRFIRRVESDFDSGRHSGVRGTPTLFINGLRYSGAIAVDAISAALYAAAGG